MLSKVGILSGAFLAAGLALPAIAGDEGAGCLIFTNKDEFESFNASDGKLLKGVEDFEESNIPDGGKQVLPAPLKGNVPNVDPITGFGFPSGLTEKNIIIQDNVFPGPNPPTVNPSGSPLALYVIGTGFIGSNSKKIGEDLEVLTGQSASIDLIFTEPNHTGVGFLLSHFAGFGNGDWHITVYNKNDVEICKFIVPDPGIVEPSKVFAGVWTPQTIGRINIWDEGIIPDAIDNIQLWEEQQPTCPWDCGLPHNKKVDIVDFLALLQTWGLPGPCDFDGDGAVDIQDFLKLLGAWGPCPTPSNDECPGDSIVRNFPEGHNEFHFDMYGATPSQDPHSCFDIVPVKDIWYCLTYQAGPGGPNKLVRVSTSVPLLIEVTAGCTCPPGSLVACGFGAAGTPQFPMHPLESVTIRLSNTQNLPNDQLKGLLFIDNKLPAQVNLIGDPVTFFTAVDQAGKFQKLYWDFKPHVLSPGVIVKLSSPLDINTHPLNPFDPWLGPAGNLWPPEVDNLQFTANLNPQGPFFPPPPPNSSLMFASAGAVPGLNNNFLGENLGLASFDILSGPPAGDNHTAIAFELAVANAGVGQPVPYHISVYDKQEVEIGKFTVTGISGTKLFVGLLTKDPAVTIGRIDIWSPPDFFEGITAIWAYAFNPFGCPGPGDCCQPHGTPACDNVDCCRRVCAIDPFCCQVAWDPICANLAAQFPQCNCGGHVNFFFNVNEFFAAVNAAGKTSKFSWNFKPDYLMPGMVVPIQDPLDINTHFFNAPNVWFQPGAINLWPPQVDNVQFWSNGNPQGPLAGGFGLQYFKGGPGLPIQNNALVARNGPSGQTSFDILSGPPAGDNHTAMAFELMSIGPVVPSYHVTVYDKQDVELGKITVPSQPFEKIFLGILSKDPLITIGRVDIWDVNGGEEGISAITAFAQGCGNGCGPADFDEGEICGGDINGGCNSIPPNFTPAACGDTICGNSWALGGVRDTDWYLVNLPDPDNDGVEELRATLRSQFPGVCFIVDIGTNCNAMVVGKIGCSNGCMTINDAAACLPAPGTYVVFVAPATCTTGIFDGIPCGGPNNDYTVSIQCNPCPFPAAVMPVEGISLSHEARH